jgi:hypothetical protein
VRSSPSDFTIPRTVDTNPPRTRTRRSLFTGDGASILLDRSSLFLRCFLPRSGPRPVTVRYVLDTSFRPLQDVRCRIRNRCDRWPGSPRTASRWAQPHRFLSEARRDRSLRSLLCPYPLSARSSFRSPPGSQTRWLEQVTKLGDADEPTSTTARLRTGHNRMKVFFDKISRFHPKTHPPG